MSPDFRAAIAGVQDSEELMQSVRVSEQEGQHQDDDCDIDAALTQAGFPDQASRNAARLRIVEALR